jgi:prepilin-type N-terminal cleavage/methylation domain-containing protein
MNVRTDHSRAYTLLELLTVIAIMGIIAALAVPTLRGLKPNAKVAATRDLLDAVGRARQLAISQRTPVYMVFLSSNFWTSVPAPQMGTVQPLLDKQLIGYAFVSLRSVGDQPGRHYPRYLSPWRTLPQGAYIPPEKFWVPPGNPWPTPILRLTNTSLAALLPIPQFSMTNNIPFPTESNPVTNSPVTLSYIAFDGTGQLISGVPGQPELIPVSEGNVTFARDANTKLALPGLPQATEVPAGNTVDNYSLVYIDRLTGRAHVERRKVQ